MKYFKPQADESDDKDMNISESLNAVSELPQTIVMDEESAIEVAKGLS